VKDKFIKMDVMTEEKADIATRLRESCARLGRRIDVTFDEESLDRLVVYAEELRRWNRAYNLIGRKLDTEGMIGLIVDALTPLSIKGLLEGESEVVDIGSGAGLPGIPLYLVGGRFRLTVVEPQRKKVSFLRHICRKLELEGVRVYPARLEQMARDEDCLSAYEVGLARAVMDPFRLLKTATALIGDGGHLVLYVGKSDGERIRRATPALNEKGLRVEAVKSMQRLVGKDNYLAVIRKARP
jgi:16S rRNA (guanine527-N7)-methyltransferase